MNLEFKGPSGPSTGHSLLVQGLEKLLANAETHGDHALESRMLEQSRTEWEGGEDTTDDDSYGGDSGWSRMEDYNMLPMMMSPRLPSRAGLSKSMPLLKPPTHFCSEVSGLRKGRSMETEDTLLGNSRERLKGFESSE